VTPEVLGFWDMVGVYDVSKEAKPGANLDWEAYEA